MKKKSIIQFIKFGIVGVSNTIVGYLVYTSTLFVLRYLNIAHSIDIYIAQILMFLLSTLWSFYWNNKKVFNESNNKSRNIFKALLRVYASYALTSLFLSEILLYIWVNIFFLSEYLAPLISLIITVPLNFVIQKFWAFKE